MDVLGAPMALYGLFIFITIALFFAFRIALYRGTYLDEKGKTSTALLLSFALGMWLLGTAMMAANGTLQNFERFPPPIMIVVGMGVVMTIVIAFSRIGLYVIKGAGLVWLVGFQGFRVLVEVFLHQMYLEGIVPKQMTYAGYNFDILAGLSALLMAWQLARKKIGPRTVLVWNIISLGLLINIAVIAILSLPTPIRAFDSEPANTFVTYVPYVWLPVFQVPAALFGHLLVFRALKQGALKS
ncbi:MAG: hypothetical protein KJT03_00630 [Verrucomicrobiae bacterium]|nr:hypothetical protein [Verrucomicrobiae bacterium]